MREMQRCFALSDGRWKIFAKSWKSNKFQFPLLQLQLRLVIHAILFGIVCWFRKWSSLWILPERLEMIAFVTIVERIPGGGEGLDICTPVRYLIGYYLMATSFMCTLCRWEFVTTDTHAYTPVYSTRTKCWAVRTDNPVTRISFISIAFGYVCCLFPFMAHCIRQWCRNHSI